MADEDVPVQDGATQQARPPRRKRRRLTIVGMFVIVAAVAVGLVGYRRYAMKSQDRLCIVAGYRWTAPVADGVISPGEYGTPVAINWANGNQLAAFQPSLKDPTQSSGDLATAPVVQDTTTSKPLSDLSILAYAAYTGTTLYMAFDVTDQFVDAQADDEPRPEWNDGIELFIDGDQMPNDFITSTAGAGHIIGSKEGFQLLCNAAGHKLLSSQNSTKDDFKAVARRTPTGYLIELEIPLSMIDTKDGPGETPPGPGSLLHLGFAVTDNDAEVHRQMSYAFLSTPQRRISPWLGCEPAWSFGIRLEPRLFDW